MRRREEFAAVVRRGRRAGRPSVVVHLLAGPDPDTVDSTPRPQPGRGVVGVHVGGTLVGPVVGFVVGKTVGNSVTRHRVQRRLRHVLAERLPDLPAGALVVVRALPAAADRTSAELATDVDRALDRLARAPSGSVSPGGAAPRPQPRGLRPQTPGVNR